MNQFVLAKQTLDFNRTTFENAYGALVQLQEQSEKMMNAFMEKAVWIPSEGKRAIADYSAMFKKGCAEFKRAVDENFAKAEAYFEQASQ